MKTQITTKQRVLKTFGFLALGMIFCLLANPMYGQNNERTVTGVVSSIDGPVQGASVILKGSNTGTFSNENGEFTFPQALQEEDVLLVSGLGYETTEIQITGDINFIQPVLEYVEIVIVAALRTKEATPSPDEN